MKQFLKRNWFTIGLILILLGGFLVRIPLLGLISGDMEIFLLPWVEQLGESGLAGYTGDYNVVYVSILNIIAHSGIEPILAIKAVSILFDVVLAIAAMLIARELLEKVRRPKVEKKIYELITFMVAFIWPSVIINSALWGQCDSIYASFCLLAILMLLRKRWNWMMVMIGVAVAFKLQAVFILPFIGIYWLTTREFPIWKFLIIPCVFFVVSIPGIIMGWPVEKIVTIYLSQAGEYAYRLSSGYPNIYYLFSWTVPDDLVLVVRRIGLVACFAVLVLVCYWLYMRKIKWNGKLVLMVAAGLVFIELFLFPQMMGRYSYFAEILVLIYLIIYRRDWWIITEPILVLFTYATIEYGVVAYFIAAIIVGVVIVKWWVRINEEIRISGRKKPVRKRL